MISIGRKPCVLLILAAASLVAGTVPAQDPGAQGRWGFSSDAVPDPNWQAQWIWLPAGDEADMLLARRAFTLSHKPEQAWLSITAGSRYQLRVNGKYIAGGPARCAAHHQSFDVLDVSHALQKGPNVLAIRVHYQREDVSYYGLSRAGLLAQLDFTSGEEASTIATDAGWRVAPDPRWLNTAPRMARFHLEVCDRMDFRRDAGAWADPDFDDRGWARARVLRRETGWPLPQPNDRPTHRTHPFTSLVARDIPYLIERVFEASRPVHAGSMRAAEGEDHFGGDTWVDAPDVGPIPVPPHRGPSTDDTAAAGPLVIQANDPGKCRVLVFDLNEVHNGRPYLDVAAPPGTVVDVMAAPYLLDGNLPSPVVMSTYVDRIVLSGRRERWEAFYMKPTRWLAVVFRHLPGEARLFGTGVVQSEYPFEEQGYFDVPDYPDLETLWNAAARTVEVCTTDAYTDNYRERRQYAQTAYYACLGNYPVFGDHALQRRYLKQIAEEQLPDGLMPAYAPRHGDDFMVILDSNCFWIRGLHQYLLYSGDDATARELLPSARKLIDLLHSYANADGLIDDPPQPYWLDHALNDRRGANLCFNGHYLAALEDFARVLQWLDEPGAEVYRHRAQRIRQSLRDDLWDPGRRLFADALVEGERSRQFSEHANAMALALRIATPEQMEAVAAELTGDEDHDFIRRRSGVVMVTPAMSYFLHAGLCEAGYADESWEMLRARFAHMLTPESNGTLWEEWWLDGTGRNGAFRPTLSGRSDAQTESAFAPGLFCRYILGIEPTQPGLREVVLHYHPGNRLSRRRGAIPTPRGLLEVAWDVSPAEFKITLRAPPETTVRVDLAGLGAPPPGRIATNGRPADPGQVIDGFLVLPPGDYTVCIERP